MEEARENQRRLFKKLKIDSVELSTEQDYVRPLLLFFSNFDILSSTSLFESMKAESCSLTDSRLFVPR